MEIIYCLICVAAGAASFAILYFSFRKSAYQEFDYLPKGRYKILASVPKNASSEYVTIIPVDGANKIKRGERPFFVIMTKNDIKSYGNTVGCVLNTVEGLFSKVD
ncbi:MAG: hypothetical protein WC089_00730 [Candidatus Paceibacterota bacterium]